MNDIVKIVVFVPESHTDIVREAMGEAGAGVAMEFMGSHQERYINGNDTAETEYWLTLGRNGLRKELG